MKKIDLFYLLFTLFVLSILPVNGQNFLRVDVNQAGQQFTVSKDHVLEVRLPSTPSNGYGWYLRNANHEIVKEVAGVMEQVGDWEFISDYPDQPIGASGTQVIRFLGKAEGMVDLKFEYVRPWSTEEPLNSYVIKVVSEGSYSGTYKAPADMKVEEYTPSLNKAYALPSKFSWLDQKLCTPVKNQGSCGSCWAFAACGSFEAVIKIADRKTVDLSEQWIVNCDKSNSGCSGGWCPDKMFKTYGAVYEADAPYKAKNGTCATTYTYHEQITGYKELATNPTVDQIKNAIFTYGPVWAAVTVGSNFNAYKAGSVLTKSDAGNVNHAIVLVGWDDATNSWVLRNSWGTSWGENSGYMRIKYGMCTVGYRATYITYKDLSTGIATGNNQLRDQVSVYPNPVADGKFTIDLTQFDGNQPLLITIMDVQGRIIYKQQEKLNTKVEVDAQSFSNGLYFVNVSSEEYTANYKIVKQ